MSTNQTMSRDELLTNCERSARYHQARERFFNQLHLLILFIVFSLGAANVTNLIVKYFEPSVLLIWATVSLLALFSLVYNPAAKSTHHNSLYHRFTMLAGTIASTPDADAKIRAEWNKNIHTLYADEPPVYRALNAHCNNQTAIAMDADRGFIVDLRWYHIVLRNLIPFQGTEFLNRKQAVEPQ